MIFGMKLAFNVVPYTFLNKKDNNGAEVTVLVSKSQYKAIFELININGQDFLITIRGQIWAIYGYSVHEYDDENYILEMCLVHKKLDLGIKYTQRDYKIVFSNGISVRTKANVYSQGTLFFIEGIKVGGDYTDICDSDRITNNVLSNI